MSLYRKYRPNNFSSLVGQTEICDTLTNQLKSNSLSHAYLFIGTRGTGKTSTAKIHAKAVNCTSLRSNGDPCGICPSCQNFDRTSDIIEMDAASNNGVDDIRRIVDDCIYPPTTNKYKVYIIDEVHMLSKGAFNALLKTLEEPPSYVIFILATTEPNKIPATILSRCLKFEFKRITANDMINRMQYVCSQEGRVADTNALRMIASNSDGAMRDALSMLEQAFFLANGNKIVESVVAEMLGCTNKETLIDFVKALLSLNVSSILSYFDYFTKKGKDILILLNDLIQIVRDCLLIKTCSSVELDGTVEYIQSLNAMLSETSVNSILALLHSLNDLGSKVKYSINPTVALQTGLALMCVAPVSGNLEIANKIDEIQAKLDSIISAGKVVTHEIQVEKVFYNEVAKLDEDTVFNSTPSAPIVTQVIQPQTQDAEIVAPIKTVVTKEEAAAPPPPSIPDIVIPAQTETSMVNATSSITQNELVSPVQEFINELKATDIIFLTYVNNSKVEAKDKLCIIRTIPPFASAISSLYNKRFKVAGFELQVATI